MKLPTWKLRCNFEAPKVLLFDAIAGAYDQTFANHIGQRGEGVSSLNVGGHELVERLIGILDILVLCYCLLARQPFLLSIRGYRYTCERTDLRLCVGDRRHMFLWHWFDFSSDQHTPSRFCEWDSQKLKL